jgi:hypothetical protein
MQHQKTPKSFYIIGYLLDDIILFWFWNGSFFEIWWIWAIIRMENPLYIHIMMSLCRFAMKGAL